MKHPELTRRRLKELLDYDPETGSVTWRTNRVASRIGRPAGHVDGRGYTDIVLDGRHHYAHRLAYLWMTGRWPEHCIDHRDGNPRNNSWDNIRPATVNQNCWNAGIARNNTSGVTGVWLDNRSGKWVAQICRYRQRYCLGSYDTIEEAAAVRRAATMKLFGEYGRIS